MRLRRKEVRMKSYIMKANDLQNKGEIKESLDMVISGMDYYTKNLIEKCLPVAAEDTPLMVIALRTVADQLEQSVPNGKSITESFERILIKPNLNVRTETIASNKG